MSSTGPRFESRLMARFFAGPLGAMARSPTTTQSAEAGSTYPTRPHPSTDKRGREKHGPYKPGNESDDEGDNEPYGEGCRVGHERGRLVGQPRQHKLAVETQEHAEEHPRHLDQRDPDQAG